MIRFSGIWHHMTTWLTQATPLLLDSSIQYFNGEDSRAIIGRIGKAV